MKAAVTIAAVQPTVMTDRQSEQLLHSSAGQVIITANWQMEEGHFILSQKIPQRLQTKELSHINKSGIFWLT
jgi:hypothetical protein